MRTFINLFIIIFVINIALYSQAKTTKETPKTYIVELREVQFDDVDFSRSIFKSPLDIQIKILENGKEVIPVDSAYAIIEGTRGERYIDKPLAWKINYKPENNYQIIVEEVGLLVDRKRYVMPQKLKTNYWPLKDNNGTLYCGKKSYVRFKIKELPKEDLK